MKKFLTKDEINELPLYIIDKPIEIITTAEQLKGIIPDLSSSPVLGFDTETKPAFKKGVSYSVSLLQLATENKVFLIRVDKVPMSQPLLDVLSNPNISKAGVAVADDIKALQKIAPFTAGGFVEIADLAKEHGFKSFGLRALAAIFLDKRISKRAKLSNWESPSYTKAQITYAAIDAYVGYELHYKFLQYIKENPAQDPK